MANSLRIGASSLVPTFACGRVADMHFHRRIDGNHVQNRGSGHDLNLEFETIELVPSVIVFGGPACTALRNPRAFHQEPFRRALCGVDAYRRTFVTAV